MIWKRAQFVSSGACLTFIRLGNQLLSCSDYKKNILQVPQYFHQIDFIMSSNKSHKTHWKTVSKLSVILFETSPGIHPAKPDQPRSSSHGAKPKSTN